MPGGRRDFYDNVISFHRLENVASATLPIITTKLNAGIR